MRPRWRATFPGNVDLYASEKHCGHLAETAPYGRVRDRFAEAPPAERNPPLDELADHPDSADLRET